LIEVESHERQDFTVNLDISSALGWFTAIYPLFFTKNDSDYLQAMIKTKESIRESPRNGIGYSYIRENKLKRLMNTNVSFGFNYLGRYLIDNSKIFLGFDNAIQLHGVPISFFDFISNKNKFPHKIKLTCWYENNILHYYFSYDSMLYNPKEIKFF